MLPLSGTTHYLAALPPLEASVPDPAPVPGPLHGLRVVELAGVGPAPFCAMLLADMGAEVLTIASPGEPEARMPVPEDQDPLWRGRSRLTLDLKQTDDHQRLLTILRQAHVLIEGFRPGVLERLGVGPDVCLAVNPILVIGRVTGWGQDGPLAQAPGHDLNYIALTGALHAIGPAGGAPVPPLNLVGDGGGGALYLALGVLAAVLNARQTGRGQVVDAAMVDGAASLMGMVYTLYNNGLWSDARGTNLMDGGAPFGAVYETADGKHVAVCAVEPAHYATLLEVLGLDLEDLPRQNDRPGWPALRDRFATAFRTRSRDEWADLPEAPAACITPVLSLAEAPGHPHNLARGTFVGDPQIPGPAPRFAATPSQLAPMPNTPAADLLARWGVDQASSQ